MLRTDGYTSFEYDITAHLAPAGSSNTLAVRVNNSGANSRWYSGSGLFRPVSLISSSSVHLKTFGGAYITTPDVQPAADHTTASATTQVDLLVENTGGSASKPVSASVKIFRSDDASRSTVAQAQSSGSGAAIPAGGSLNVSIAVPSTSGLQTWGPANPVTYTAEISLMAGGEAVQTREEIFGYRSLKFDPKTGFTINGESMKMYGGCVHHDNGPLGSRAIGRAEERRVELLKKNGYNAIRTSHNPVSRAFVQACNKHGVMLMEEAFDCWGKGKNVDDYHLYFEEWWQRDIQSMVLRDRNNPSIVMWSVSHHHLPLI